MKFFTTKQWRQHMAEQREAVFAALDNKPTNREREQLNRYRQVVDDLWAKHSKPYPDGQPGDSKFGQTWWCSECRAPWPCKTARVVFEAKGFRYEYAPLRLAIRGEKRLANAVQLGSGHWMRVEGVEPCRGCRADEIAAEETSA